MLDLIGWLGSIALGICALPQAFKSVTEGHSDGISWGFLLLWLIGEVFTLIYVLPKSHIPLILNYALNIILISIILYYKIKPIGK